jgi:hypothetical protein
MELKALKLVKELEAGGGQNKDGKPWSKCVMLFDMQDGEYVKPVVLSTWDENAKKAKDLKPGTIVDASVNINCREYNGNWYTNLTAWKIKVVKEPEIAGSSDDFVF